MLLRSIESLGVLLDLFAATGCCRLLSRATILLGDSHTDCSCERANRLRKTGAGVLDQKCDGAAVRSTTKTVIELFRWTNGK